MRTAIPAAVLATALGLGSSVGLAAPSSSYDSVPADARTGRASLSMSPTSGYLPGSDLTLTGSLGTSGRQRIVVQRNLGRAGDSWIDMDGSSATTQKNGSFVLHVPASGMNGIQYRVAGATGSRATPPVDVNAAIQETVVSAESADGYGVVRPGAPLTFTIDTTVGSGSFAAAPPLAGRVLTLQQRVDGFRWSTLTTSSTDADGNGTITVAAPSAAGNAVYRVRQEDWRAGRDEVGWHASHPVYVAVGDPDGRSAMRPPASRSGSVTPTADLPRRPLGAQRTAGATYQWRDPAFEFDWEYGESLTTPATRGSRLRGWWSDYADGTGRAVSRNGAALMSSISEYGSRSSANLGSTWITLNGNPRRFGRWETRVLPTGWGTGSSEMRILIELIPSSAAEQRCSVNGIVLADYTPTATTVGFGARAGQQWTRSAKTGPNNMVARAFAVEVTSRRITWFIDGRPVGTLEDAAALPSGPLTMRASLVGDQSGTNARAKLGVDWVRGWSLKHGKQARLKRSFAVGANPTTC